MLNALIIEDESPAMDELISILSSFATDVQLDSRLNSVSKVIDYLSHKPPVDIIFSVIQLPDGLSFGIFNPTYTCAPVIFIANDEEFMQVAFDYNCLAYLLRPVEAGGLRRAVAKYRMLDEHFQNSHASKNGYDNGRHTKHRMIVKKGKENISLAISDIALFHSVNRSVCVIDYLGQEYTAYKSLFGIEQELDREQFFRVNRQYIVNINFIHGFKTHERVKLRIELTSSEIKHPIIVSQEMAPQFREWMYNA